MTSKERMKLSMSGGKPDRIPVMCQLSLGHIYKHARIPPDEYWYSSEGLAEGYIRMADRYRFDGILLSKTGINPETRKNIRKVEKSDEGHVITWQDGSQHICPPDEYPRPFKTVPKQKKDVEISNIDPDKIKVMSSEKDLPPYFFDVIDYVKKRKSTSLSIHGEVGTVFEHFLLMCGSLENGLMALLDDPKRCKDIMEVLNRNVIISALAQCARGIDALKLSSPMAGAGFISRDIYEEFVLPYEKEIISNVHSRFGIPCYIHTCGAIGDRLDLMVMTGTDGLECLDPLPLGTVDLSQAVDKIGNKVFIKGNLDSVNELAGHSPEEVKEIARQRIEIGRRAKGYILSSACSVSPVVPPENIEILYEAVENK